VQEARARHEMALELLGERNEAVEELEDAVAEMKCAALLSNAPARAQRALQSSGSCVTCSRRKCSVNTISCEGGPQHVDAVGPVTACLIEGGYQSLIWSLVLWGRVQRLPKRPGCGRRRIFHGQLSLMADQLADARKGAPTNGTGRGGLHA